MKVFGRIATLIFFHDLYEGGCWDRIQAQRAGLAREALNLQRAKGGRYQFPWGGL